MQPFIVYTVRFRKFSYRKFFGHDCSLKLSIDSLWYIIELAILKKSFPLKNNSALLKLVIHYLEKEVQDKPAGDKDVDIVYKDSTSYSIDGGVQLKKPS